MSNDRQQQILKILEQKGEVHLQQLKDIFQDVSMMTLRRDLINLENDGQLIRTYGGAVNAKKLNSINGEEFAYSRRAAENVEAKLNIAQKAVGFVEKGRSIYFDAGSTIMCMARALDDDNYSIVTCGANIALELVKKQNISVVSLGGLVNRNTLSMSGPNAMAFLDSINIDVAFMAASGFTLDSGFTVSNIYECELKKKILSRAKKVILLIDTSKINKILPFTFAKIQDIHTLVVEKELPEELRNECEKRGIYLP